MLEIHSLLLFLGAGLALNLTPGPDMLYVAARSTSEGRRARSLRGLLVAGQIALCVSLLTGAGLLTRSLVAMTSTPLGVRSDGVLTVAVQLGM